ncbi:MAG: hypothetical protein H7233_05230 [Pseudorhodobacter sp.]|nr:hypothetical protein [Frankiaceae bacterium]
MTVTERPPMTDSTSSSAGAELVQLLTPEGERVHHPARRHTRRPAGVVRPAPGDPSNPVTWAS